MAVQIKYEQEQDSALLVTLLVAALQPCITDLPSKYWV